jgi:hypothetical protein
VLWQTGKWQKTEEVVVDGSWRHFRDEERYPMPSTQHFGCILGIWGVFFGIIKKKHQRWGGSPQEASGEFFNSRRKFQKSLWILNSRLGFSQLWRYFEMSKISKTLKKEMF